ncbi:type I DNA topoisomerase [Candidatus Microgenomates bacterium]|nr:MAG: type I DNA topoisomerase [Candidatus Microgenomates bacterium]
MSLILVESPTKAKTLSRFLGKKYRVVATFGHIRDLGKGELSVDVENNFKPKYVIPKDKAKRVKELRGLVGENDRVILATDPDREGEAIAYHMAVILSNKGARITSEKIDEDRFQRITFHEITEDAIKEALEHPGKINYQLVDAQQARRVLDRLVGYNLSPLLWRKLSRRWLSAGRVQSIAVRLIVEREREIQKFTKAEFWEIEGEFTSVIPAHAGIHIDSRVPASPAGRRGNDKIINANLVSKDSIKYAQSETIELFDGKYTFSKTSIATQKQVDAIIADFASPFTVSAVDKKEVKRNPAPPYTTSAMQIDAGRKLGYTSKRIMQLAQNLYEEGVITYHRTDSVNLATKFLGAAAHFIENTFGKEFAQYRTYATKSKMAQEAHEAIRPTQVALSSEQLAVRGKFGGEHLKLYDLIWKRAVASQMAAAIFDSTKIGITSSNGYQFETQGSVIKFEGFLKVMGRDSEGVVLPDVAVNDTLHLQKTIPTQKFTQPPPRYSEASLIKTLEEDGIGRPSTYAPTLATIQDRLYVAKEEKEDGRKGRNFIPTELGFLVNDFLVKYFSDIINLPFTATMESTLDEIAEGKREWVPVIAEFFSPFNQKLKEVEDTAQKQEAPVEKTGEKCPQCQTGDVIIKQGRFGKFMACSRFPDCKFTKNIVEKINMKCPTCKEGDVVVKKTKRGRRFYGCSRYPDCDFAAWKNPALPQKETPVTSAE